MLKRLPRYLVITGSGVMVVGITLTVVFVARRSHCSANPYEDNSACLSYNSSIHWAYAIVILGAALLVVAALTATAGFQRWATTRKKAGRADGRLGD